MAAHDGLGENERNREIARLERLACLLDEQLRIPGTRVRVGLDALIGLVPGGGDVLTGIASAWIVWRAWRLGASARAVLAMLLDVVVDVLIGSIPVAGDVFDVVWKANVRNVALLRRDLRAPPAGRGADHGSGSGPRRG